MLCPFCNKLLVVQYKDTMSCRNAGCEMYCLTAIKAQWQKLGALLDGLNDCLESAQLRGDAEQIEKLENILK